MTFQTCADEKLQLIFVHVFLSLCCCCCFCLQLLNMSVNFCLAGGPDILWVWRRGGRELSLQAHHAVQQQLLLPPVPAACRRQRGRTQLGRGSPWQPTRSVERSFHLLRKNTASATARIGCYSCNERDAVTFSFGSFWLARAYVYALFASGTVNTQGFTWKVFYALYIKEIIHLDCF